MVGSNCQDRAGTESKNREGTNMKNKIDRIDRILLKNLQEDATITNIELSKRAGISAPPCLRRVRMLEEQGIIRSHKTILDHKAMGYPVEIIALVKAGVTDELESKFREWEFVREAKWLGGEYDYLLTIRVKDLDTFKDVLKNTILQHPHVNKVDFMMNVGTVMHDRGVPVAA